jgi:hypothetical protein
MKYAYLLFLNVLFIYLAPETFAQQGCTDPNAMNYDPSAIEDDGSCYYAIYGCTDPAAVNYDPFANFDNGSCYYYYYGCTDANAVNYDPNANFDDGSCYYYTYGCTNPSADNYDPNADIDDGSCYFSGTFGCTDPNAANYNSSANYDDGSCYYYYYGCTDGNATNYDPNANFDDGSCAYYYDCYGEVNGTAYYDDCGDCIGGNTGLVACVVISIDGVEHDPTRLRVYPNPTDGPFTITIPKGQEGNATTMLTDAVGRIVMQRVWTISSARPFRIDLALEDGIYTLNVITKNGQQLQSLITIIRQ